MSDKKYELTSVSIQWMGKKLFQIKALKTFWNVKEGELWGYIEKEENLSQVYGNAWVSGNAWVYGNARVSAKLRYTKGWFIGGNYTEKVTKLTREQVGNDYWKANYVLGDFDISPIEEEMKTEEEKFVTDENWKKYKLVPVE